MKRIMVIGVSAGVGKSTFAKSLGEKLNIKVHHLDTFYWKPNWIEASRDELVHAQEQIIDDKEWIIEGNYTDTFQVRVEKADTLIYLELPLYVCLYRVLKRRIIYHGKTRSDMTVGCPEKIDWAFIKFILTTYFPRKRKMAERFQNYDKKVIVLKNRKEIKTFLKEGV
ncbi:topology modulation protein [Robertmurraya yapensis]|uniref:Topology modulation protein n=1 Tax=Bacillus yapensis TaxID=2492960 RepID=A0A431WJE0_9BACI|nr:topology modulation protein [Bacillus yapensis]RTR35707.1 topology modulation protein [Bacillus yapensis]TKS98509.1 topology modulation protein [Bacillus yapensis]